MPVKQVQQKYCIPDEKPYCVHMGHLGIGLTVWNTLEKVDGDYKTIALIDSDRTVRYVDDNLPPAIKEMIEKTARTSEMTVSATQDTPVFCTPPQPQGAPGQDTPGIAMPDPAIGQSETVVQGYPKVYMASLPDARQNVEITAWRESLRLNQACAKGIQKAINDSHNGQYSYNLLAALKSVTAEYGMERVHIVLANTVQYMDYDGRFSRDNKQWAQGVQLPVLSKEYRADFVCGAHPAILDGFINTVRKQQQEKRPSVIAQLHALKKPTPSKKNEKARNKKEVR